MRSCLFTGNKRSLSHGLLAAQDAVSNEIRFDSRAIALLSPRWPPHDQAQCAQYRICQEPAASCEFRGWSARVADGVR